MTVLKLSILSNHSMPCVYKTCKTSTLLAWGNVMPRRKQAVYKTPRFSLGAQSSLSVVNKNKNSLQFPYYFKTHKVRSEVRMNVS